LSWKGLIDKHVLWVAYQVAQFDMASSTWSYITPSLNRELLMNDVWIRLIVALMFIVDG
jgi:hypothetical protein